MPIKPRLRVSRAAVLLFLTTVMTCGFQNCSNVGASASVTSSSGSSAGTPAIPSGYPLRATDVGVTASHCPNWASLKRASGEISTTGDGQVIENLEVTGTIHVKHSNVIIRCVRSAANDYYNISLESGSGLLVEDSELLQAGAAAIASDHYTARRVYVHDQGADGFKAGDDVVIENSYIERLGSDPSSHADGVQISAGSHIQILNSNFQVPTGGGFNNDTAVFIGADFGDIDDVLIQGNRMNGGGWTINMGVKPYAVSGVLVQDNVFGRDAGYGPLSLIDGATAKDNSWEDTGAAIP